MNDAQSKIRNPKSKIRRRAFSFVEVLFAVMILGIGFIMIAGIFPVAIAQTQSSGDETVGAAVARGAVEYLAGVPYSQIGTPSTAGPMKDDGKVYAFGPAGSRTTASDAAMWNYIKGRQILPEDPRYGWVAFYRRTRDASIQPPIPASYAQVIVVATRVQNHAAYDANDLTGTKPSLVGKEVEATFTSATEIDFNSGETGALAPYTYVIIAEDRTGGDFSANGWILRLGSQISGNRYQLLPGNDFTGSTYRPNRGTCYIVGQGTLPGGTAYSGGAQDIAAYSSFIRLD